jgi:CRP/FNR family transcriptional regulator, cyclic AMP receptor protein
MENGKCSNPEPYKSQSLAGSRSRKGSRVCHKSHTSDFGGWVPEWEEILIREGPFPCEDRHIRRRYEFATIHASLFPGESRALTLVGARGSGIQRVRKTQRARRRVRIGLGKPVADLVIPAEVQVRQKHLPRQIPAGCAACSNRRPGWFCSLGSAVLADLELATSTISLPAQASLFTQGEDARCLYLICSGYLKLTAGRADDRQMIVRVAGPGSMLGLYAVLSHGVYEVSAESLTTAQLRPVERDRFLSFLRSHKEAQMRAVQCICQEYRFALQDACRIALSETVATRLGRLLLELAHQIGEHLPGGEFRFPLLLTHEEMASMTCTTRETVTRTLGQFRKAGWISIEDSMVTVHQTEKLQMLL